MSISLYQNVEVKLPLTVGHLRTCLGDWGVMEVDKESWERFLKEAHSRDPREFGVGDLDVIGLYQFNAILLQLELEKGINVRLKFERRITDLWTGVLNKEVLAR